MTTVRKAKVRKALTAEIRALRKIEAALAKASTVIVTNSYNLTGDVHSQIAKVYEQLNIAVTVTDSAAQETAYHLARTY